MNYTNDFESQKKKKKTTSQANLIPEYDAKIRRK